ncbi:hypothetical protein S245_063440, partial [Arachis hypogaea]
MAMLRKLLPRRKSILTDIAEAKYNYWSTFAANPFEVVLVAGKKAKLPGGDEEENKCDLKDLTGEGNIESMLFFKQGLRELASLKDIYTIPKPIISCLWMKDGLTPLTFFLQEMSYNNYLDADAAWNCVCEFRDPTCVVVKHTNPSGVASRNNILEAYRLAASPVFIFANQAELDMLETTLVALQDIMLNKVLDESGKKILCSEFSKIMQQRAGSKLKSRIIAEQFIHKWSHVIEEERALRKSEIGATKDENMITHKEEIFSRSKRTWFVTETEKKVATKAAKKNFPRKRRKLEAAREMLEDEGDDDRPEVCTSCLHL